MEGTGVFSHNSASGDLMFVFLKDLSFGIFVSSDV